MHFVVSQLQIDSNLFPNCSCMKNEVQKNLANNPLILTTKVCVLKMKWQRIRSGITSDQLTFHN